MMFYDVLCMILVVNYFFYEENCFQSRSPPPEWGSFWEGVQFHFLTINVGDVFQS